MADSPKPAPRRKPSPSEIDPLTRLAIRHGTDKWGPHFYTPIYHRLLAPFRDRPVRFLEIGVGGYAYRKVGGASLAMWAEYFPKGRIVGIDIEKKDLDLGPRVSLLQGSQTDAAFLRHLTARHGPFDVILDDGSHVPADVVASFAALFPALKDGGLYIIEDVQTAFWPSFGGEPGGGALLAWATAMLRGLNHAEIAVNDPDDEPIPEARSVRSFRAFHNLFVVEKGDNTEPSNYRYDADNRSARQAIAAFKEVLALNPTAAGLAQLGWLYGLAGNDKLALRIVVKALKTWPDDLLLLTTAARLAGKHNAELAGRLLARAIKIDPEDPALRWELAALGS